MRKQFLYTLAALSLVFLNAEAKKAPRFGKDSIADIVAAMTLDEKVNLIVGNMRDFVYWPDPAPGVPVRIQGNVEPRPGTAFSEGRVKGAAGETYAIERLGVPSIVMADGPAGLRIDPTREGDSRTYYCTAFPTGSSLAASWDRALVDSVGMAIGDEARRYGVDIVLAPALNIMRSPLCGRNFEYYSEDPVLAGLIAGAYAGGIQKNGVGATLKHYAVNNQETMRNGVDAVVSDRALRDIYLKGFRIAVGEAHPMAVMSSYNSVNGSLASENKYLLTDILRNEWNFDGFVMTDWWAEGNGARQTAAGNDMLMPGTWRQYDEIMAAVKDGSLSMDDVDRNVAHILRAIAQTPAGKGLSYNNDPDLMAHGALARRAAAQGMVLLKNRSDVLPVMDSKHVALFGNGSYETLVGGYGSGNVNRAYDVDISEGLRNAGLAVDTVIGAMYADYLARAREGAKADDVWTITVAPELGISVDDASKAAQVNDMAVFTISRVSGESDDRKPERGDWYLSPVEQFNLVTVTSAFHSLGKPVVVLMNMGAAIDMAEWHDLPDAILYTWLPGQEAGNAIADVITGKVNPSGRLPFTVARHYEDYPSASGFPEGRPMGTVYYTDDIMVGYRHFDQADTKPLYPFGAGMGYTDFAYSNEEVVPHRDGYITYAVDVTNTGALPGAEVVQVYNMTDSLPNTLTDNARQEYLTPVMPKRELVSFGKTRVLQPGETERVVLQIPADRFRTYNPYSGTYLNLAVNLRHN